MMDVSNANDNQNALASLAGNYFVSLIKEHPKATKAIASGALSLFFGWVCFFEITH